MSTYENLKKRLHKAGQAHLLKFWNELSDAEKTGFAAQLDTINFDETNTLFRDAVQSLKSDVAKLDSRMKPISRDHSESEASSTRDQLESYRGIGMKEIGAGRVAALLLAGGQGTRLGVTHPKGMYSVGLPSGKTLFQIQAERIVKLQELARAGTGQNGIITWYIMTSGPTQEPTEQFLKSNKYFGLDPKNVIQFKQGLLPCFDMDGRIILEDKGRVALAPDGNGGIYRALKQKGILDDMRKRGIEHMHAFSVDNILVKIADPIFIGYCAHKRASCAAKVVKKTHPTEAVGVVCLVDDQVQVVEYSEITEKTAELRDKNGELVFSAANICNHYFSRDFLNEIAERHEGRLKLHVAKKKIAHVNEAGKKVTPSKPNGIKIEKFIFDVFPFSSNFVTWEVPRQSEFSALKNAEEAGKDCPSTARNDLFTLHKRYVEDAGGSVDGDVVEISPLVSYAGEGLTDLVKGKVLKSPVQLN